MTSPSAWRGVGARSPRRKARPQWTDAQLSFLQMHWRSMLDTELAEKLSEIGGTLFERDVREKRFEHTLHRPKGVPRGGAAVSRHDPNAPQAPDRLKGSQADREKLYLERLFEGLQEEERKAKARALAQQEAA